MNRSALNQREIHPDFQFYLDFKSRDLINLYKGLRTFIMENCAGATELLYNTHALTSVYSITGKLVDGFCMIPIYSRHLNLGFNKGTLLPDPMRLLQGTGKLIRHIPIAKRNDFDNPAVKALVQAAMHFALIDTDEKEIGTPQIISKIKH